MATGAVDLPYLASHYAIPETALSTLTHAPTVELVNQLLESITKKAHDYDELKSDKLRLDVELENAVRSNESKIKVLKNTVDKGHSEIDELRKKLHESGIFFHLSQISELVLIICRKHAICPRNRNLESQILLYL